MNTLKKINAFGLTMLGMIFILFITSSVSANSLKPLSEEDLLKMQEEIKTKGLKFQVGVNSVTHLSLNQLVKCSPSKKGNIQISETLFNNEEESIPTFSSTQNLKAAIAPPIVYNCVSSPVKNQGAGSSWPFASTDMFESVILLKRGILVDLSEQWLLDCNPYGWDQNNGWFASDIFFRDGAVLSSNFPPGTSCIGVPISFKAKTWNFCQNGHSVAPTNAIKNAILSYGSVACMVYVDNYFVAYVGGVFNSPNQGNINHFVTLCGWDDTKNAWRLKNTWGTGWGENGYMWIEYGCHDVGWAANYLLFR